MAAAEEKLAEAQQSFASDHKSLQRKEAACNALKLETQALAQQLASEGAEWAAGAQSREAAAEQAVRILAEADGFRVWPVDVLQASLGGVQACQPWKRLSRNQEDRA